MLHVHGGKHSEGLECFCQPGFCGRALFVWNQEYLFLQLVNSKVFDLRELPVDSKGKNCLPAQDLSVVKRILSSDTSSMNIEVEEKKRLKLGLRVIKNPEEGCKIFSADVFEKNHIGILSPLGMLPGGCLGD